MKIFLWGMMGSGKTSLAQLMANEFEKIPHFLDLDQEIEKSTNQSINQLFTSKGEEFFRIIEHDILKQIIKQKDNFILATGGGTPVFYNNYQLMYDNGLTIYLQTSPKILAQRLFSERNKRPLIKDISSEKELENFLEKLLKEREPYYKMAHVYWDTTRTPQELIKMIKIMLGCDFH